MKIKLNFETDVETVKLVSKILKWASRCESDLTESQKTSLSSFSLNLLMKKNEQAGMSGVSPMTETLVNFLGADLVKIDQSDTNDK